MKCKRMVLPLLGTAFEPGRLADTLNEFEDEELAEIAQAEAYFFQHRQKPDVYKRQALQSMICLWMN